MKQVKNLIIGAGPAGIAVAGRMKQRKIDFVLLEKSSQVANSWHHHYDRLHLHTIKSLSHLPGLKFPKDYPTYVPREKLIEYYEWYCKEFSIEPAFGQTVHSVQKFKNGWKVETNEEVYEVQNVIFATGINRKPHKPTWPGLESFSGEIIHSSQYKNPTSYKQKTVLIIGMGNTGAEIAFDLSESEIDTFISVRSPVNIVPRDINGNPVQSTAKILAKIPFGTWIGKKVSELVIGDLSEFGLEMSKDYPVTQLKETGKTPVIDIGTVKNIKNGKIKILPEVVSFEKESTVFKDKTKMVFDAIILATGYRASLYDFLDNTHNLLDKHGYPKSPIGKGDFKGLYFVGYDNYKLGGVLGTIFTDSKIVVDDIC